jgi:hypothetical protein
MLLIPTRKSYRFLMIFCFCVCVTGAISQTRLSGQTKCPESANCYKAHSDEEVLAAQKELAKLLKVEAIIYANGTGVFREQYGIPLIEGPLMQANDRSVQTHRRATLVDISSISSTEPDLKDAFSYLLKECSSLSEKLNRATLSGLGAYIEAVNYTVEADFKTGTVDALKHSFKEVDEAYKKLSEVESNLTLPLEIKSVPTGSSILIATKYQSSQNRSEFSGSTDVRGINIYRGIYDYTISVAAFTPAHGRLDLVDNPPKLISCSSPPTQPKTLICTMQ